MSNDNNLFLGLDLSTQGLKCTLIDESMQTVYERALKFDRDLPEFNTKGGVHAASDGVTVTAPAKMWVAALDRLLAEMKEEQAPFSRVVAVSGSGQQHGSVWLNATAERKLQALQADASLTDQLRDVFSREDSPVWMDSSTTQQCAEREKALGGAQATATLTGSRAYERFTGNQIAKIAQMQPEVYAQTYRICLVSSFMASLMVGKVAPIDASDGSGMNLMDIERKAWSPEALECTAPELGEKLGAIVASHECVGTIHNYFVERYGFNPETRIIAFSGDNPNSLAGLQLQNPGDIAISLGTSDTVFGFLETPKPSAEEGHVFVNPVDPDAYMALLCFKNGSLTREAMRDSSAKGSWKQYAAYLDQTAPGNAGRIGFYMHDPEITPPIMKTGMWRFDAQGNPVEHFTEAQDCRALYEGQFLSMRLHAWNLGYRPRRLLATGGASVDASVIRVMCDVFGVPVYLAEKSDSASLGAAYRALHGWQCTCANAWIPYRSILEGVGEPKALSPAATPDEAAHDVYTSMLARYADLEKKLQAEG